MKLTDGSHRLGSENCHVGSFGLQCNMSLSISEIWCVIQLISGLVRRAEARAQELAARLAQAPHQAAVSAPSPKDSPVEKLISAARASVKEIAESAAHGNEALDAHLRGQPSSSEEGSVDMGEAEVASRQTGAAGRVLGEDEMAGG